MTLQNDPEVVRSLPFREGVEASTESDAYDSKYDELIPDLPNDLTVEHIFTKVPAIRLTPLSRSWRAVVKGGDIRKARDRRRSVQQQVAVLCSNRENSNDGNLMWNGVIFLYNPSTNRWHQLPPIPDVNAGIPSCCECSYHDGKLYVIGGLDRAARGEVSTPRKEVYSMDLQAGTSEFVWNRCADMFEGRAEFSSGIIGGKIYVFENGVTAYSHLPARGFPMKLQAEVYNPLNDTWRALDPKLPSSNESDFDDPTHFSNSTEYWKDKLLSSLSGEGGEPPVFVEGYILNGHLIVNATSLTTATGLIYVPEKDQWWMVLQFTDVVGPNSNSGIFRTPINGNLWMILDYGNEIYCMSMQKCSDGRELGCQNLGLCLNLCHYDPSQEFNITLVDTRALGEAHPLEKIFCAVPSGNGELLVMYRPKQREGCEQPWIMLSKSKGIGDFTNKIEWNTIECPYDLGQIGHPYSIRMCLVERKASGERGSAAAKDLCDGSGRGGRSHDDLAPIDRHGRGGGKAENFGGAF